MSDGQRDMILEMFALVNDSLNTIKKEIREDISKLHSKVDDVKIQTTKTNGRVTEIEKKQAGCKISEVHTYIEQDKIKNTKQYQIGSFLLTISTTVAVTIGIISLFKML